MQLYMNHAAPCRRGFENTVQTKRPKRMGTQVFSRTLRQISQATCWSPRRNAGTPTKQLLKLRGSPVRTRAKGGTDCFSLTPPVSSLACNPRLHPKQVSPLLLQLLQSPLYSRPFRDDRLSTRLQNPAPHTAFNNSDTSEIRRFTPPRNPTAFCCHPGRRRKAAATLVRHATGLRVVNLPLPVPGDRIFEVGRSSLARGDWGAAHTFGWYQSCGCDTSASASGTGAFSHRQCRRALCLQGMRLGRGRQWLFFGTVGWARSVTGVSFDSKDSVAEVGRGEGVGGTSI